MGENDRLKRVLTDDESRAVQALQRLARRWPKTLRLVLAQGKREVRACLCGDVEGADDLAEVPGVPVAGLKIDSHS